MILTVKFHCQVLAHLQNPILLDGDVADEARDVPLAREGGGAEAEDECYKNPESKPAFNIWHLALGSQHLAKALAFTSGFEKRAGSTCAVRTFERRRFSIRRMDWISRANS